MTPLKSSLRQVIAFCLAMAFIASTVSAEAPQVGIHTSPPRSFSTATYWLEGAQGVVLIDTQFLPQEGQRAMREAERTTGKKVTTALVLHPNPDKFNGTASMQASGVQVFTSAQVASHIPAVHKIRLGWFAEDYKPDYPVEAAKPSVFGAQTVTADWSGVKVKLHVLGPGCSAAHVVAQVDDAVFVGDLINPDNHAWLELGLIDDWLRRLDEIRAMTPKRVFPGRGLPGGPELIERQAEYLRFVQKTVQAEKPSGSLGWLTKLRLQRAIEGKYPALGYPIFVRDGLEAVWRAEALKAAAPR
jgi:glyoxylase-like metal-dependent hydrolase (beta-lactamase superfamily II)